MAPSRPRASSELRETSATGARALFDVAKVGLVLRVHVQPGGRRDSVVGTHGDALKVRVSERAESGRANEALLSFLARTLGVRRSVLRITSGTRGRDKRVEILGIGAGTLEERLHSALPHQT
jgi:uncharacterized protein